MRIAQITFTQEPDSLDALDNIQEMIVTWEDAGGGAYPVLETARFAFNDIDELAAWVDSLRQFEHTESPDDEK